MKKLFVIAIGLALLVASCNKDDDPVPVPNSDYLQLETGNYWIYQNFIIEDNGAERAYPTLDSVVITGDTLIRGNLYSIMEGTNFPLNGGQWDILHILRDSAGYLVEADGTVLFSDTNFSDTLYTQTELANGALVYTVFYTMEAMDSQVHVPAGSFDVLNFKGEVYFSETVTDLPNPRIVNQYYARGVGRIFSSFVYASSNAGVEKRLLRYHIAE